MYNQLRSPGGKPNYPFVLNAGSDQARGLIGWWPGIANDGILRDFSGQNHNGTFHGNFPTSSFGYFPGKGGGNGSLRNNGAGGQYVSTGLVPTLPFSISAWAMFATSGNVNFAGNGINNTSGFNLGWSSSKGLFLYYHAGGNGSASTTVVLTAYTWHHFAATMSSSIAKIYVDGIVGANTGSSPSFVAGSNGITICGTNSTTADCRVEDVKVWNRSLSASEVLAQYENPWQLRYSPGRIRYFLGGGTAASFGKIYGDYGYAY